MRKAGLKLKTIKWSSMQTQVEYLGHIVSQHGVYVDPMKTAVLKEFPRPLDLRSSRPFVGLAYYYWLSVPGFSHVAGPLYALTRKDTPFVWSDSCQEVFVALKRLLTEHPFLVLHQERGRVLFLPRSRTTCLNL